MQNGARDRSETLRSRCRRSGFKASAAARRLAARYAPVGESGAKNAESLTGGTLPDSSIRWPDGRPGLVAMPSATKSAPVSFLLKTCFIYGKTFHSLPIL